MFLLFFLLFVLLVLVSFNKLVFVQVLFILVKASLWDPRNFVTTALRKSWLTLPPTRSFPAPPPPHPPQPRSLCTGFSLSFFFFFVDEKWHPQNTQVFPVYFLSRAGLQSDSSDRTPAVFLKTSWLISWNSMKVKTKNHYLDDILSHAVVEWKRRKRKGKLGSVGHHCSMVKTVTTLVCFSFICWHLTQPVPRDTVTKSRFFDKTNFLSSTFLQILPPVPARTSPLWRESATPMLRRSRFISIFLLLLFLFLFSWKQ